MLTFENLTHGNLKEVAELEKNCFGIDAWSENLFFDEIGQENKHYTVCRIDNKVAAYGGFARILDEGHIMNIAVASLFRRQGVASKILERMVNEAKCSGINAMTLEVRESNSPARRLYEKHGFLLSGVRTGYYRGENACIYWKVL